MILTEDINYISAAEWRKIDENYWDCIDFELSTDEAFYTQQPRLKEFLLDTSQSICRIGDVTEHFTEYKKIAKKKD